MSKANKRKRVIPKVLSKKARGQATAQLMRMNGAFKKIARVCRVCQCTDDDCSQCVAKTGTPCHWVEPDLCSACT